MRDIDEFLINDGGLSKGLSRDQWDAGDVKPPTSMVWPGRLPKAPTERRNVRHVLDKLKDNGIDGLRSRYVADISGSIDRVSYMDSVSPCLTRSRASSGGHWLTWKQRKMHISEVFALQGVPAKRIPEGILSERQMGAIAGNAVPVPLLKRVMRALFQAAGLLQ
jgi:site-specific DNA-cytosine methylase